MLPGMPLNVLVQKSQEQSFIFPQGLKPDSEREVVGGLLKMCHGLGLHSHIGGWSSIHLPMVLGIFISRDGDGFKKDMALACSGMLWQWKTRFFEGHGGSQKSWAFS